MASINVEVVYVSCEKQRLKQVIVEEGADIQAVIHRSGLLLEFPEINLNKNKVGVFSKIRKLSDLVKEGDRVEIYRSLLIDPKEARRLRVSRRR